MCEESAGGRGTLRVHRPIMDGIEATERICAEYDPRVIMLTGLSSRDMLQQAIDEGACGHVSKPFARDQILPVLLQLFDENANLIGAEMTIH